MICYRVDEMAAQLNLAACNGKISDERRNWCYIPRIVDCPKCKRWLKRNGFL